MGTLPDKLTREISLDLIDPPRARVRFDNDEAAVEELARSIEQVGLLQAILLRQTDDRYEIVAGERRFLAHKLLGRPTIPATVTTLSDADTIIASATENLQRKELSPVEEAATYKELRDTYHLTEREIAQRMGRTPGLVTRRLRILEMPSMLSQAIHLGKLSVSACEELALITDPEKLAYYLYFAIEHGATVLTCRYWAATWRKEQTRKDAPPGLHDPPFKPETHTPTYSACHLCDGPLVLGDHTLFYSCPYCAEILKPLIAKGVFRPTPS